MNTQILILLVEVAQRTFNLKFYEDFKIHYR